MMQGFDSFYKRYSVVYHSMNLYNKLIKHFIIQTQNYVL